MIGTLKVTPEEMQTAAGELSGYIGRMTECFDALKRTMQSSSAYWTGDAANAHRELYSQQIPKTEEFIRRLNEHVKDLNTMAGVYQEAEQTATNKAEELPMSML